MAKISTPKILFDPATILSRPVTITTESPSLALKRGQIVMYSATKKAYEAVAISALDYASTAPAARCVIILEDTTITKPTAVKAIVAGTVYVNALRELGYNSTKLPSNALDVIGGFSNIRFVEEV